MPEVSRVRIPDSNIVRMQYLPRVGLVRISGSGSKAGMAPGPLGVTSVNRRGEAPGGFRRTIVTPEGVSSPQSGPQVSLMLSLARAARVVLTAPEFVVKDGYYSFSVDPIKQEGKEVGLQMVFTRIASRVLRDKVTASLRQKLGAEGATIPAIMWSYVDYLVELLPEKVLGQACYFGPHSAESGPRLPEPICGLPDIDAACGYLAAINPDKALPLLLLPVRMYIERLLADPPQPAAQPTEIRLDDSVPISLTPAGK